MKHKLLINVALMFLVSFLGLNIRTANGQELIPEDEKQALIELFNSTNGAEWKSWTKWDLTASVDQWKGVKIKDGHVSELDLHSSNLQGKIPASIGALTELVKIRLDNNLLEGPLPKELFQFQKLQELWLTNQRKQANAGEVREYTLTGGLPDVIDMPQLKILELSDTGITGPLSEMKTPELLQFQANNCTLGSLHPSIWELPKIIYIGIQLGESPKPLPLTGELPKDFSKCATLQALAIGGCPNFVGEIPASIAKCTGMQQLLLQNGHTGTIPKELGTMKNLVLLALANNHLTGEIPEELGNLTNLVQLYLGMNELTGTIPESFKNFTKLNHLNLKKNKLTGNLPEWIGQLHNLTKLILGDNEFTGTIPAKWAPVGEGQESDGFGINRLLELDLANLKLSGELPERFGNFTSMDKIWINNAGLSGDPTTVLQKMLEISQIYIQDNNFKGRLDGLLALEDLEELRVLYAQNNHFYGSIEEREHQPDGWGPYYRFNAHGINVSNNDFKLKDFEKLSPILTGKEPTNVTNKLIFAPQNKLEVEETSKEVKEGEALSFTAPTLEDLRNAPFSTTDLSETKNVYQWYKDGKKVDGQNTPVLSIDKVNKDQSGVYVCKITNARVPGLTMETKEMIATVKTGILPIEANQEVIVREGDILSVKGAESLALYTTSGNLLSSVEGNEISINHLSSGTIVIVIYTTGGVNKAVKYIL